MIPVIDNILGRFSQDLAIDLGTVNTLIHVQGKGVAIYEPSIVAQHKKTKRIVAIGQEAKKMVGRTPANIMIVRPLRDGVISDYDATLIMLSTFVRKIHKKPGGGFAIPRPKVVVAIPSQITEVEKRALIDVARTAGAREVFLVEEPLAAAMGSGMNVNEPCGLMICDIGGGTTEIAVISMGGIVVGRSLKIAGNTMDLDIAGYVRTRHSLSLGEKTREEVKILLGSAYPMKVEKEMVVRGSDLERGLPKSIKLSSVQIREALSGTISVIVQAVKDVVEDTPPELAADIS
ncbi:rod shape-determining protein, partial [Candidatus Curtissbacteria bacterium RBG_13_40_7]